MQYTGCCPSCGGQMKPISIGWKCEKCSGLVDMHGGWHEAVNEPFVKGYVLKEQDEVTGGKYRRAIEWIGKFGELFVEYEGDPRGPVGRAGNMRIEDEAQLMPVITDVDGGKWRPVQEEILQDLLKQLDYWKEQNFKACYEKQELSERAERSEKALDSSLVEKAQEEKLTPEELRGMVGGWVRIVHLDNDEKTRGFAYVGSDGIYTYLGHSAGKYTIQAVFEFEECGKAFWAYPYHPAHIDRGKWDSCIKCNGKCYFCKFNETSKCGECNNHNFYSPMFNFCPDCGRPLTPEAWAELEKRLRG